MLAAEGGNKTRAAQRLGLDRKTLYRKLEEYAAGTTPPGDDGEAGSRNDATELRWSLEAQAEPAQELLRSPVIRSALRYWRLRIVEHLTAAQRAGSRYSPRPRRSSSSGEARRRGRGDVRRSASASIPKPRRIEATPTLHRRGDAGRARRSRGRSASAASVTVEEVIIRAGDAVTADGILQDLATAPARSARPARASRSTRRRVRLPSRGLGPAALIPWAFGTAAALLGGMGLATWAAWRYHLAHLPPASAWRVGSRPLSSPAPAQLSAPEIPRPRFP